MFTTRLTKARSTLPPVSRSASAARACEHPNRTICWTFAACREGFPGSNPSGRERSRRHVNLLLGGACGGDRAGPTAAKRLSFFLVPSLSPFLTSMPQCAL